MVVYRVMNEAVTLLLGEKEKGSNGLEIQMQKGSDLFRLNFPFSKKRRIGFNGEYKKQTYNLHSKCYKKQMINYRNKKNNPHLLQNQAKTGSNLKVCCVINKESKTKTNVFLLNHSPIFRYLARRMVRGISPLNAVDETMNVHHRRSDHFLGSPLFLIF